MKVSIVKAPAYIATHGVPEARGGAENPQIKALWAKWVKLEPIKHGSNGSNGHSGEYIVVEKSDEQDDLRLLKNRLYSGLRGYVRRQSPRMFALRLMLRRTENHVLVWKEQLPAQPSATAERIEQPCETPSAPLPRDRREKGRPAAAA
jgi:hypothetical protein